MVLIVVSILPPKFYRSLSGEDEPVEIQVDDFAISGLTIAAFQLRIPPIPARNSPGAARARPTESGIYDSIQFASDPNMSVHMAACKHPRVKIVARQEDSEFVECIECGEVFESSEFKDMNIEETKLKET